MSAGSIVGALFAALAPACAFAANICWVEQVKRRGTGIDIYFMDDRTVTLMRANQPPRIFQTYSARTTTVHQIPAATVVEAVPAVLGDRLYSSNTAHDSCGLTVVVRDGRIGIEAQASMQIGVEPPATAKKFMPAG